MGKFRSVAGCIQRSAPLLVRTVVKKASCRGCPSFSLGAAFRLRLYCWPPPAALRLRPVLYLLGSVRNPDPDPLPGFPGLASDLPCCCGLTRRVSIRVWLSLAAVSGSEWDPDLPLCSLAPCWRGQWLCLPCFHSLLPNHL